MAGEKSLVTRMSTAESSLRNRCVTWRSQSLEPAALDYLALVTPIWPQAYREQVGMEGFSRAPVGTGPYRITKFDVAGGVEYERFDGYYEGGPKGKPAIRRSIHSGVAPAKVASSACASSLV